MNPRKGARGLALGRAAFGAALLLVPERVGKGWLGEYAERPAAVAGGAAAAGFYFARALKS